MKRIFINRCNINITIEGLPSQRSQRPDNSPQRSAYTTPCAASARRCRGWHNAAPSASARRCLAEHRGAAVRGTGEETCRPSGLRSRSVAPASPLTFGRALQQALPDVQVAHLSLPPRPRRRLGPAGPRRADGSRRLAPGDSGPARRLQAQPAERQRSRQLQQHPAWHRVPAAVAAAPGFVLQHQGQRLHFPAGPGARARPGRRHRSPAPGEARGRRRR